MVTNDDILLEEMLHKPVGPTIPARQTDPDRDFTRQVDVSGDTAAVTLRGQAGGEVDEDAAVAFLRANDLDPAQWKATGFRSSEWTMPNGDTGVSRRFTFQRNDSHPQRPPIDDLIRAVETSWLDPRPREAGSHGFLVLLGDMQFGKIDGDGAGGTLQRTIDGLEEAACRAILYGQRFDIGHIHIAWLGDHVEGFQSQGGANAWRTPLTLSEQIRLTRRVMLHALQVFAPLAQRLTMAAVPGNHGETHRFAGKGVTRYDDSHDTEALLAVADAATFNEAAFGHVEFYVPRTDEMTVVLDVAGTVVAHAHGHQWRPGRHMEWWRGQAFNKDSPMHQADVLAAGHLHHEFVDTDGPRTFIQPPAMESESTWWRHSKGTGGAPGLIVAVTKDGAVPVKEVVRL